MIPLLSENECDDRHFCRDCAHLNAEEYCRIERRQPVLYVPVRCATFKEKTEGGEDRPGPRDA